MRVLGIVSVVVAGVIGVAQLAAGQESAAEEQFLGLGDIAPVIGGDFQGTIADDNKDKKKKQEEVEGAAHEGLREPCSSRSRDWPRCRDECRPGGRAWPVCQKECRPGSRFWPRCRD